MYTLKKCNVVKMVESEYEKDKLLQKGFCIVGGDKNAGSDTSNETTEGTTASGTTAKNDTTGETKGTSRARK